MHEPTAITRLPALTPTARAGHDLLIDVRAPSEYAEDHVPGAVNMPVLNDAERAEVGRLYTQVSPFVARRRGAGLVAANIARHLAGPLADCAADFRPLVYCWRGGQRSGAFATVLAAVGWPVSVLDGGYKAWRHQVTGALHNADTGTARGLNVVLLDGQTGTGKTALLQRLTGHGIAMLDLEGLARHRGSAFGAITGAPGPSHRAFEGALYTAIQEVPEGAPVLVEAESRMVGAVAVPNALWAAMAKAPRIEVRAPFAARLAYLRAAYADIAEDPGALVEAITLLKRRHSAERIATWCSWAESGAFDDLAAALMAEHYDPLYAASRKKRGDAPAAVVRLDSLDAAGLDAGAAALANAVRALNPVSFATQDA